jgi:hypothetical protein
MAGDRVSPEGAMHHASRKGRGEGRMLFLIKNGRVGSGPTALVSCLHARRLSPFFAGNHPPSLPTYTMIT